MATKSNSPTLSGKMHRMLLRATLLLLFLFFCCTITKFVMAKRKCGFSPISKNVGPRPKALVIELPRKGRSGVSLLAAASSENNGWEPIRISFFTEDLNDPQKYCTEVGQERISFSSGEKVSCKVDDLLTEDRKNVLVSKILPGAIKLHSDRLLVQRIVDRIVVPNYTTGICSRFTIPSSHHTEGVKGTDLVLYVAAGPGSDGADAWATYCSEDHVTSGRPIVGVILFNPYYIFFNEEYIRLAAHEIGHVLGFDFHLLRTKRMVKKLRGTIRNKTKAFVVTSPTTVNKTRGHFNCPTAPGMEMDEDYDESATSHWGNRNAKDELMAVYPEAGLYTTLTMALFEDLGYYRANWSMAETMNWGKNAGCKFLEEKCFKHGKTEYPDMFCIPWLTQPHQYLCTSDRTELGRCLNSNGRDYTPEDLHYFRSSNIGSLGRNSEYCFSVNRIYQGTECADGNAGKMLGSRVGPNSKCLKGKGLKYKNKNIGDVCAEIECNNGTVRVRHLGNDTWYNCSEGHYITPGGDFNEGTILCPKYYEVCREIGADNTPVNLSPPSHSVIN